MIIWKSTKTGDSLKLVDVTRLFYFIIPTVAVSVLVGLHFQQMSGLQLQLDTLMATNSKLTSSVAALSGDVQRLLVVAQSAPAEAPFKSDPHLEVTVVSSWGSALPYLYFIASVGAMMGFCFYFGGKGFPPSDDGPQLPVIPLQEVCNEVFSTMVAPLIVTRETLYDTLGSSFQEAFAVIAAKTTGSAANILPMVKKAGQAHLDASSSGAEAILKALESVAETQLAFRLEVLEVKRLRLSIPSPAASTTEILTSDSAQQVTNSAVELLSKIT